MSPDGSQPAQPTPPVKRKRRQRLTPRQNRLARYVARHPDQTQEEAARAVGYSSKQAASVAINNPKVVDKILTERDRFKALMDQREDLSRSRLLDKVAEGLEAVKTRTQHDQDPGPDHATRHRYIETALELRGATGQDVGAVASGPINIGIILGGGGTDQEREAITEVLLAARRARGLHPTENRKLQAGEEGYIEPGEVVP